MSLNQSFISDFSEYYRWSQRTKIKYKLHYGWCTGRRFTAATRHNTSCSKPGFTHLQFRLHTPIKVALNVNTKYSQVWYQIKGLAVNGFTIDDLNGAHSHPVPTSPRKKTVRNHHPNIALMRTSTVRWHNWVSLTFRPGHYCHFR